LVVAKVMGPVITGTKAGVAVDPWLGLGALLLSAGIGVLSSAYPALHASKLDPTVALRSL